MGRKKTFSVVILCTADGRGSCCERKQDSSETSLSALFMMDGGESGTPVRIVVASLKTGKCVLNTYITADNLYVLKTESLCRLVACVSNIFDSEINNDNGLPTSMLSFLELDQLWVYVKKIIPLQMFVALICTPGYAKSNAEMVLSIILKALLRSFENAHILNNIKTICEKSAKDSEKYTANSSMSTKSIEPATISGLATVEDNVFLPLLKQHFEYGLGWYDTFFNSIPNVTCFILRIDNFKEHQIQYPENRKQKYRIIHRINVKQRHAICVNVNIRSIISEIKKDEEEWYTTIYDDITSSNENKLKLWCIKLFPSPFYIMLVVDNEIIGPALPLEKLHVIIETCKARMKNAYDKLQLNILNIDNNKNIHGDNIIAQSKSHIEGPKAITVNTQENTNQHRVRIMELHEQENDTNINTNNDGTICIQPKPPPRRENTSTPKNASIRVSRTTLKEISPDQIEKDLPGVQMSNTKGGVNEILEAKLMSTIGGSAVGSGARAVAQMKN